MDGSPLPDDRREDRLKIILSGHCSDGAGRRSSALISDLSTHGCKVRTSPTLLHKDATVWIKLGSRDPLEAHVRWHKADFAGVEWENSLHPAILDHIYAAHDASREPQPTIPVVKQVERQRQLRRIV